LRILVTGAHGFVGRWLVGELTYYGHDVVAAPPSAGLDFTDRDAVQRLVRDAAPDAIAHLAAVSFAGDARRDAERAIRVNVGGTAAVFEAARNLSKRPVLLVTGSSEVYGPPRPEDLPLRETSPLRAAAPYGLSKLAQEGVAVELASAYEIPLIVTRAFNHIGPGQRPEFVVPALAGPIPSPSATQTSAATSSTSATWSAPTDSCWNQPKVHRAGVGRSSSTSRQDRPCRSAGSRRR
jgi:GDP-4-dehydro-6-deoxy-D-mannose reductase